MAVARRFTSTEGSRPTIGRTTTNQMAEIKKMDKHQAQYWTPSRPSTTKTSKNEDKDNTKSTENIIKAHQHLDSKEGTRTTKKRKTRNSLTENAPKAKTKHKNKTKTTETHQRRDINNASARDEYKNGPQTRSDKAKTKRIKNPIRPIEDAHASRRT